MSPQVPTAVCPAAGIRGGIHFRSVQSKTNRRAKGQGSVWREAGRQALVASTGIIRNRQAPPASGPPPAARLFINAWWGGFPKQQALGLRGSLDNGRCLHIRRQSLPLSWSPWTRRNAMVHCSLPGWGQARVGRERAGARHRRGGKEPVGPPQSADRPLATSW